MTASYTPGDSDRDRVRQLIGDTDVDPASDAIFSDEELDAFLLMDHIDSEVLLAAAEALETMASTEAYVTKRIQLLDLKTDGPAVAKSLMDRAATLRQKYEDSDDGGFDIAEMVFDDFSARERLENESMRNL